MLIIRQRETCLGASGDQVAELRTLFQRQGHLTLPALMDQSLLTLLLDAIDRTTFERRVHEGIGVELCAPSGPVSGALEFLMNDPDLLNIISSITGCGPIGCFEGRLYRLLPNTDHHDSWHSDVGQDRMLALAINLGREPFEGGRLQIKRMDSCVVADIENARAGDAVLFRIDPALRHRVEPVVGANARTVYAGWFREKPDFRELFAARIQAC